jgi:Flp pilus assembly protein TadD
MLKRILLLLPVFAAALAAARDKPENWIRVQSPHSVVVTNSNEKQGRHVADQFERMRSMFHTAFPKIQVDPGSPIVVLAIKDEKDFRALEPEDYLAKGSLKLGGLFLRAPDKNYVLMRMDAEGEHPYSVVYHEYTHLIMSKAAEWMPLWMNEGLAQFYQNTDIHEKDVSLGQPDAQNILMLRQNRLLPLATLFAVDDKSPYYHEEHKGSIFYAQSWALTHYLFVADHQAKTSRLAQYSELLIQKVDPVTAATQAFGDLKHLQSELEGYIRQDSFSHFKMTTTTEVDESAFKVKTMPLAEADAVRADFLAYNGRTADAQTLLDHILQEDPQNVSAQETLGFVEFHQGHVEEARKRYAQAAQLDSQSYLAHYYFAAMSMNGPLAPADETRVEASLRSAIKLNPVFAPTYDRLAVFLGMHNRNLEEARMMGLTAISLDPANIGYRINVANLLLRMNRGQNAVEVLRYAAKMTKTPQESDAVDHMLMNAQEYAARQSQSGHQGQVAADAVTTDSEQATSTTDVPHLAPRKEFVPSGPHRFVIGVLKSVHCDAQYLT